jgi:hypothetical protein
VEPNLDVILARRLLREQGGAVHAVEVHKGCGRCDNCLKGMYTACLNYGDLNKVMAEYDISIFFVALQIDEYDCLERILKDVQGHLADIKVVPGAYEFLSLRGGIDQLDDIPIVSLQGSPLYGWNTVLKRIFDLILGASYWCFCLRSCSSLPFWARRDFR